MSYIAGNHSDVFKPSVENMVVACAVCMAKPTVSIHLAVFLEVYVITKSQYEFIADVLPELQL